MPFLASPLRLWCWRAAAARTTPELPAPPFALQIFDPGRYCLATRSPSGCRPDRFAAVNGIKPVKQYVTTISPDYFDITYECMIWTEYMEQMNKLVEQVSFEDDEYWGERGKYKFRTEIKEYKMDTVLPTVQDRLVRTSFNLNVHAYLLPERMVDKYGKIMQTTQKRYTTKKIVTFTEIEER